MATVRDKKLSSAMLWNRGARLFDTLLANPTLDSTLHNEILVQSLEAYVESFELMYGEKKRLEVLTKEYLDDFLHVLVESHSLHLQTAAKELLKRKLEALTKLKEFLSKHHYHFTKLETELYNNACEHITKCNTVTEIDGRLLRPGTYPVLDNQTYENRLAWKMYVLARADRGAAKIPAIQESVRGKCKSDEAPTLEIIQNRMQLLCYQPIVDSLSIVLKNPEILNSQKQQAFRDYKNMASRTDLIVPPPSYTSSQLHGVADSYVNKDINLAIQCYTLALMESSINAEEKRDIHISLADCYLKQKEYPTAIGYLKSAYIINLSLEENSEDNYSIYHKRGKIILIELMRVIDIHCGELRNLNEKNNYHGIDNKEGIKDQKLDPKNLLLDELDYNNTLPLSRYKQPTVAEYSYGCRFFAADKEHSVAEEGLALRDGDFHFADYTATKSKPNIHHYVAACVIQASFSKAQLEEYVRKITTQKVTEPRSENDRVEEIANNLVASALQP